jgi:hypothetical protein
MRIPILAPVFLVIALATSQVSAEPVRIVGGVLSFDSGDPLHYVFEGDGFRLTGFDFFSSDNPGFRCLPCAPGTLIDLDALFGPGDLGQGFFGGDGFLDAGTRVFTEGTLRFDTGATLAAAAAGVTSAPFIFTGELAGYLDASRAGVPLFQTSLVGQGRLLFTLAMNEQGGGLITDDMTYVFEDSAPVPEPATVLLAAAGLGCIARRRYASRSARLTTKNTPMRSASRQQ